jgi:hypothetical protein
MRSDWLKLVFFCLSIGVHSSSRYHSEKRGDDSQLPLETSQRVIRRRRLARPGEESVEYDIFRRQAIPFAEPRDDSSKSIFFLDINI